jgi:hypothetical protein
MEALGGYLLYTPSDGIKMAPTPAVTGRAGVSAPAAQGPTVTATSTVTSPSSAGLWLVLTGQNTSHPSEVPPTSQPANKGTNAGNDLAVLPPPATTTATTSSSTATTSHHCAGDDVFTQLADAPLDVPPA